MGMLPSHIGAMVLASAIACAGLTPASAAPTFLPDTPKLRSDVVLAQNSVIIRRENSHHDGGGKRRHHRRDNGHFARDHHDGFQAVPPESYPEIRLRRIWELSPVWREWLGRGPEWDRWRDWDGNRWDGEKRKHRVRIHKPRSFTVQGPSEALQDILTAVPQ